MYPKEMPHEHASVCTQCKILQAELDVVNEFSESIGAETDLDDIFWIIADKVAAYLGLDDCVLYLREDELLVQKSAYGVKVEDRNIFRPITIPIGSGVVGTCAATMTTQLVDDVTSFPGYIPDQFAGVSELAVPVIFENRLIGVFDSESEQKNAYTQADSDLLQTLARLAAPRIQAAIQVGRIEESVFELLDERGYFVDSAMMESGTIPIPGQQIGEFKLDRLLGLTDTKTLWAAHQQRLDRPILLRVLHRLQSGEDKVEEFLSPSIIAASLQHKNITQVYESGFVDGWNWVAQEHVLGSQLLSSYVESLSRLPSLPEDYFISVSWIFRRALNGVQFAHSHNIVHGNISVDELIWRPGKEPKLLGFGRNVDAGNREAFSKDVVDLVAAMYHAITFRRPDLDNLVSPSLIRPECPDNWDIIFQEVLGEDDKEIDLDYLLGEIGKWENVKPEKAASSRFRTWLGKFSAT
ncbi:MAG: hypothetical protein COB96_00710 [Planctomycetota bacterium]|nr:MAG: hypothetical protein COB96_00710 [Planctomycetota bacterium]